MERMIGTVLSAWELAALTTGRLPTISGTVRRNPVASAAVVGWLAHHLLVQEVV